jgi:hypothetical protein
MMDENGRAHKVSVGALVQLETLIAPETKLSDILDYAMPRMASTIILSAPKWTAWAVAQGGSIHLAGSESSMATTGTSRARTSASETTFSLAVERPAASLLPLKSF